MLKKKIEDALNKQVNAEIFSAYLYLAMNAYFEFRNLSGFGNWMRIQAMEEMTHAMKIYDFINERGGRAILTAINGPKNDWQSIIEVFEETYAHEQKVTGLINDLVNLAQEEKDHATTGFLQWFVTEQVEEEANASRLLEESKRIGDEGSVLFLLDRELKLRVFTPPAAAAVD